MADPNQKNSRGPGPGRPREVDPEVPRCLRPVGDISESAAEAFLAEADLHRLMPYSVCRAGYTELANVKVVAGESPDAVVPDGVEKKDAECRSRFRTDLISWARELLATFLTDADALRAVLAIRTIHKKDGDDIDVCCTASFIQTLYGSSGAKAAEAAIGITDLASRRSRPRKTLKAMHFESAARLLTPAAGLGFLLRARSSAAALAARPGLVLCGGVFILAGIIAFTRCVQECGGSLSSAERREHHVTSIPRGRAQTGERVAPIVESEAASVPIPKKAGAEGISDAILHEWRDNVADKKLSFLLGRGQFDETINGFYQIGIDENGGVVVGPRRLTTSSKGNVYCEGAVSGPSILVRCSLEIAGNVTSGILFLGWLEKDTDGYQMCGNSWRIEGASLTPIRAWCAQPGNPLAKGPPAWFEYDNGSAIEDYSTVCASRPKAAFCAVPASALSGFSGTLNGERVEPISGRPRIR